MATNWFTSDHHFNHEKIIEYCNRPFKSAEHMDREMIRRWNERVKPGDTVYHLGDFCFRKGVPVEGMGHGEVYKARGYRYYADQLNGKIILFLGNHDSRNEVDSILVEGVIHYGGIDWYLAHEPHNTFKYNLCGHVHNNWKVRREGPYVNVNCSVDVWNFYPVAIAEILQAIQEDNKSWSGP